MRIDITNHKNGVKAILTGFSNHELETKIGACQNGQCQCDCDPVIMQKIEGISLDTEAEHAVLTVTGDVDVDSIAPMMESCLIGDIQ